MKIELTENLLSYLSKLYESYEAPICVRFSLPDGQFWMHISDDRNNCRYDTEVYSEGDLIVTCDSTDYEILRGTTVDYEMYGLHECVVFKDSRFNGKRYILGDRHPAYRSY